VDVSVTHPPLFGVTRTYRSFSQIAQEVEDARVWGGIHFRAADVAGRALESGDLSAASLSSYTKELARRLAPAQRAYAAAQRWVRRPWVTELVVRRAQRSPYLHGLLEGVLDESVRPDEIFRPSTFLRSLVA
jgi:hypothetical protein